MKRQTSWWLPLLILVAACSEDGNGTGVPPVGFAGTGVPPIAGTSVTPTPTAGTTTTGTAGTGAPVGTAGTAAPIAGTAGPVAGTAAPYPTAGTLAPAAGSGGGTAGTTAADCQGFKLEGLMHSPGGSVLPNKCMPFHPTTNNPYAVRCTDAWPWYKTEFPGDDYCILPPPPDKGIQYGVHPQGAKWYEQVSKGDMSGYKGLSTEWTMLDGEEEEGNYETRATNMAEAKFYRSYPRMRPGSHHMIVSSDPKAPANEKWGPASTTGLFGGTSLPGAQRPDENNPKSLEKPTEDSGLFRILPPMAPVTFNMHHFNASGKTILKEAWTNVWWEDDARIRIYGILGLDITQVATMAIQPGRTIDLHYSWNITQPIRLLDLFGHRHAWTSNFSAWVENPDGKLDILYQSFEWLDEPTYRYDSLTKNPAPAPEMRTDGAHSGIRMLMPGQKLHFNCHIEYTPERAATEKAPSPNEIGTLRFANEAFTGEMCILFGSTAATQMPTPVGDLTPLPDFATLD